MTRSLVVRIIIGCCLVFGAMFAAAQCGSGFASVRKTCGGHCSPVVVQICPDFGTECEEAAGEMGFGCCGLQIINPALGCSAVGATPPKELLPTAEFLALKDSVDMRKQILYRESVLLIASCGPDRNAFNNWLRARLLQKRDQR